MRVEAEGVTLGPIPLRGNVERNAAAYIPIPIPTATKHCQLCLTWDIAWRKGTLTSSIFHDVRDADKVVVGLPSDHALRPFERDKRRRVGWIEKRYVDRIEAANRSRG